MRVPVSLSDSADRLARRLRPARASDARERIGLVSAAFGAAFLLAYFVDPSHGRRRRRHVAQRAGGIVRHGARRQSRRVRHARARVVGAARRSAHPRFRQARPADDVTLAHKVETEIFRPPGAPKGTVNVDAARGVVFLRGTAPTPDEIERLEHGARAIRGVDDVVNLLHLPGTPARRTG